MAGYEAPWIDDVRSSMDSLLHNALDCVGRTNLAVGELQMAENAARKLMQRAPFRESGHLLLMRVHEESGNRAEALWVYESLRALLDEELGTQPGPEVAELHRRLLGAGG